MENATVSDDSLSTASRASIVRSNGATNTRTNSLISRACDGTFKQRKTIALTLGLIIAVAFAIVGGVLGRSIASRPKILKPDMSICSFSPRLVIADDNSTGTLRGVRACGRRAWDSEETGSHMVYLSERENCLLQGDGAELHIPLHTHMKIFEHGNVSQDRSSTLKFITNITEIGEDISILIENSVSLGQHSSLNFVLNDDLKSNLRQMRRVADYWQVQIGNPISVSGPSTITVHKASGKYFWISTMCDPEFESCQIYIDGITTIEGSLLISSAYPEEPTSLLQLDSGTLEQNVALGLIIAGNLKISKGAVLRLEGKVCYSSDKGVLGRVLKDETPEPANITLEGKEVFVRQDQPYRTESGMIQCFG